MKKICGALILLVVIGSLFFVMGIQLGWERTLLISSLAVAATIGICVGIHLLIE